MQFYVIRCCRCQVTSREKLLRNILVHFTSKLGLMGPGNFALAEILYDALRNVEI